MTCSLHDHIAIKTQPIAQHEELLLARVTWGVLTLRRIGKSLARTEDMAMGVDRAWWKLKVGFGGALVPVQPPGCFLETLAHLGFRAMSGYCQTSSRMIVEAVIPILETADVWSSR